MSSTPHIATDAPRILIVDDDGDNRMLLEVILARQGFATTSAACGAEALMAVAVEMPDLVLLDVMMPMMSGYEVLAAMKNDRATQDIVVVMVTALSDVTSKELAMSAGADGYFTKPLDGSALCANVKELLRHHSRAHETTILSDQGRP